MKLTRFKVRHTTHSSSMYMYCIYYCFLIIILNGCIQYSDHIDETQSADNTLSNSDSSQQAGYETIEDASNINSNEAPMIEQPEVMENLEVDPEDNRDISSICVPKPILWRTKWSFALDMKSWVDELVDSDCTLSSGNREEATRSHLRAQARYGDVGNEWCYDPVIEDHEAGCWVTLPSTSKLWKEEANPEEGFLSSGNIWTGVIDARRNLSNDMIEAVLTASHTGSSAVREITRRWNANGQLTFESHRFNHQKWSEITYIWENDLLVQIDSLNFINNTGGRTYNFTYDDQARLITSELIHKGRNQVSGINHWSYDEQGRPNMLTRQVIRENEDAQTWLKLMWYYTSDGQLSSRTAWTDTELLHNAWRMQSQDSYGLKLAESQYDWDQMTMRWNEQDECLHLPSGIEHGYPSTERTYDLGWKMNQRPEGIDEAHGYQRIYRVGMLGWFGHLGPQGGISMGSYITTAQHISNDHQGQGGSIIELETKYLDGRPLSECAYTHHGTIEEVLANESSNRINQDWFQSSGVRIMRRDWVWQNDVLQNDRLSFSDGQVRVLEFTYDQQNNLIERTLKKDESLIARHTWTYHENFEQLPEQCKIAQYEIGHATASFVEFDHDIVMPPEDPNQPDREPAEDESLFDAYHVYTSEIEGACNQFSLIGPYNTKLELQFDEQGRLTRQVGDMTLNSFSADSIQITYDEVHNQVSLMEYLDQDGNVRGVMEGYEFTAQGMLKVRWGLFDHYVEENYDYVCQ